jgi:hypothetical protein
VCLTRQNLANSDVGVGGDPPRDTERSTPYVRYVLTTLLVLAGVLVGLVALLALIVALSARPATRPSGRWVADTGRRHPDAWSAPAGPVTSELPTAR